MNTFNMLNDAVYQASSYLNGYIKGVINNAGIKD